MFAVKGLDNLLGTHRHQIGGSGELVDLLLGMAGQRFAVAAGCTLVGVGHGIVEREEMAKGNVANSPSAAAVAGSQKSSVPGGKRHPDLDVDVRVRSRRQRRSDPAKCRQISEDFAIGCGISPPRNRLSCRDRGVLQLQTEQARACRGRNRCCAETDKRGKQCREERARRAA